MTFLQNLSGLSRNITAAFIIVCCLTLGAAAQKVGTQQDQGKRYGDAGFRGEPINLNVVNADIRDILSYITEQYGINFVIDKSVKQVPVTVNITDVPWNVALDSILRSQELGVQVNGPILRIADSSALAAESEIAQKIRDNQLDSSPLYTEFIRLNYARAGGSLASTASSAGSITGSSSSSGSGSSSGATTGGQGGGSGLLPIINRRLSRRGAIEVDERSNTLIVTDVRENIDAVRQLVSLLDQPEPQVEIEARVVVATRNFSRDIGVQLAALVIGNGRNGANSGASGSTLPGTSSTTGTSPGGVPTGIGANPDGSLISNIPNTVIGLTTGIFGTAQLSALITAGEQKGQAKTIATPRVTTLNNRKAEIKSGSKIPITTVQPGSAAGGAIVATTEYVDVPLRLEITPQITDAGTVILNVTAENSSTAPIAGSATPAINTQSMTSQIMVPDGGTTVVGGVLFDDERESQDRTPGLGGLPIIGNLFKRKGVQRNTSEILFFITPRIYRPDYQGNPMSGTVSNGTRTTTILQPVPLGNPASNSFDKPDSTPAQQPATIPVIPANNTQQTARPAVQQPAGTTIKP